jgi:pimeloyl-ACP methyl ester carboxylesterase
VSDAEPTITTTVREVPVAGGAVHVRTVDADGPRAVVLVAGQGVAPGDLDRLAPVLSEIGPVHIVGLPGSGDVPRATGPVSVERWADAVEEVLDALGLVDPVLVGHSTGTQVVTEVAARRPALRHVVLVSPVVDATARSRRGALIRALRSAAREPGPVRWHVLTTHLRSGWRWFHEVLPPVLAFPIEHRADAVQARTLVVRGEHDALAPRDWVRRLGRAFPYAVLREIEGGSHTLVHTQADLVAALAVAHAGGTLQGRGVASLTRVAADTSVADLVGTLRDRRSDGSADAGGSREADEREASAHEASEHEASEHEATEQLTSTTQVTTDARSDDAEDDRVDHAA